MNPKNNSSPTPSTYFEPMPEEQLHRIIKAFERQGGLIIINDEMDRRLEQRHTEGITYNAQTIVLHSSPSRSAVFEELIHATQYRTGKMVDAGLSRIICEIEAQRKLIKYKACYKITDPEDIQTRNALKKYLDELEKQTGGVLHGNF